MPKFSANLSMLFNEVDFIDRFRCAKECGFDAVEYMFPYDYSIASLQAQLQEYQLTQVLQNLPAGDWAGGERGIACLPDRISEFRDGVELAIEYARALNCPQINCLIGNTPLSVARDKVDEVVIENLRFAATALAKENIRLLIEPINKYDMPAFYLQDTRQALAIIDAVGSEDLYIQYDVYHMQRMEGELTQTIKTLLPKIGHIQIADNPGRHEPGTGEINYDYLLNALDSMNYNGWVGCEYKPKNATAAGLSWIKKYQR